MKTCRYGCCTDERARAKDFRQGAVDVSDFEDTFKPRKRGRKGKKTCAKSKTGEACNTNGVRLEASYGTVYTCSRCSRHTRTLWRLTARFID